MFNRVSRNNFVERARKEKSKLTLFDVKSIVRHPFDLISMSPCTLFAVMSVNFNPRPPSHTKFADSLTDLFILGSGNSNHEFILSVLMESVPNAPPDG